MVEHPAIRKYLWKIKKELGDIDNSMKRSILREIEEHLEDKLEQAGKPSKGTKISSKKINKIIEEFGEPKEIAKEYKRQLFDEKSASYKEKKRSFKNVVAAGLAIMIVLSLIISTVFLVISDNDEGHANTMFAGTGLDSIKLGEDMDDIQDLYGEPEVRDDSENVIWLSYRNKEGLDFLVSKQTDKIIEIRFNQGFDGSCEDGLKIGSSLEEVLDKRGDAKEIVKANQTEASGVVFGTDKVLYEIIDDDGDTVSYKFIDGKDGILFWFDSREKITQIVVFSPL